MSIETVHENVNGDQRTTKRVPHEGDVYEFEATEGEYEYVGEGTPPAGAVTALQNHLGEGESVTEETADVDGDE